MKSALVLLMIGSLTVDASESFSHKDWQVVCDNTHTCRMAGYTEYTLDNRYFPLSMLFERKAGAQSQIDGYIQIAESEEESDLNTLKNRTLKMSVGKQTYLIDISQKLPQAQTDIIINALRNGEQIGFIYGDTYRWDFSQKGSFASMLKMDDYQKRIGTVGAFYKKGERDEGSVLRPKSKPVIRAPRIYADFKAGSTPPEVAFTEKDKQLLQYLLGKYYAEDGEQSECWMSAEEAKETLRVYKVTDQLAVASQECWRAAYNYADAFWLINVKPPFEPKMITQASGLFIAEDGTLRLFTSYKGRGLGDCWDREEWVWDGRDFVDAHYTTTGLCMGFPGGAWDLPALVTEVKVEDISN